MNDGHCGLLTEELVPLARELLEVDGGIVQTALELELADGSVVADSVGGTPCIFLAGLHRAERVIAERIVQLSAGKLPWPTIDPALALPWIEAKTGLALAPGQIASSPARGDDGGDRRGASTAGNPAIAAANDAELAWSGSIEPGKKFR